MSISTLTFNSMNRSTLMKLKTDAATASYEMLNERYQDVGLELGRLTGTAVSYRVDETSIDAQTEMNKLTSGRLEQIQDVLDTVRKTATDMTGVTLVSTEKYSQYSELGKSALQSLQSGLATSVGGLYLFGGRNADAAPIPDVDAGLAAAKTAYQNFLTGIGRTAATVTKEELGGFLSDAGWTPAGSATTYRFMDTVQAKAPADPDLAWKTNWSKASDGTSEASISKTETVPTSVSANDSAFRKIVAAYSMLAVVNDSDLNADAKTALRDMSTKTLAEGQAGVVSLQALVGTREGRLEAADTALKQQKDIVNAAFTRLEGVDQTEASLRFQNLETQLNAAYTITGRLQKLSILEYI